MILWKLRDKCLNLKWATLWPIIKALGLAEWADRRWYRKFGERLRKDWAARQKWINS